jgi:hypothetical protein
VPDGIQSVFKRFSPLSAAEGKSASTPNVRGEIWDDGVRSMRSRTYQRSSCPLSEPSSLKHEESTHRYKEQSEHDPV